jgi:cell division transport system permease protein
LSQNVNALGGLLSLLSQDKMNATDIPKDGNRRLRTSYASAVISISLVLFMLGLLGLLVVDARKISDYVKEHVQLNIFLQDNITNTQLNSLLTTITTLPYVRSAKYVSKEEALDSLKKDLGEGAVSMIESNPLPATIDVNIWAAWASPDSLRMIKEKLSSFKPVIEVAYQQDEVDKMNQNFRTVAMIILVFCGLLLFVAVVLINNTIRLSLYSKRFLIKSMQLVGATKGFIRWPFLKKGLLHGFYAGIISIILLSGIIYLIHQHFPEFGQLSDIRTLGVLFCGVVIFGFILSGLSTFFAVNRYLHQHIDELY